MTEATRTPSRVVKCVESLVRRVLPARDREAVFADVAELAQLRAQRTGPRRARAWQIWRLLQFPLAVALDGLGQTPADRTSLPTRVEIMLDDFKLAWRSLRRSPMYVLVTVLTLTLGVGINATIFTLVNTLLLRPLPVDRPSRLVEIYSVDEAIAMPVTSSYPDYRDLSRATATLSGIAAHSMSTAILSEGGLSSLVYGELVSGNYFEVLGVDTALGRPLTPADERANQELAVVLGHGFWNRRFNADPAVLGSIVRLSGLPAVVVGVARPGFNGMVHGLAADFWLPTAAAAVLDPIGIQSVDASPGPTRLQQRGNRWLMLKGRLADGATIEQARAEISATFGRLAAEFPDSNEDWTPLVVPAASVRLHPAADGTVAPVAAVVLGMVGLVLVIACTNIAGMALSRASAREQEMAVRLALGSGKWRLVRQLLGESTLLALAGGTAGLALAVGATRLISTWRPPLPVALNLDLAVDARVAGFTFLISFASAALFGLAPALRAARSDVASALRSARGSESAAGMGLRGVLVSVQVAVSVVLLVGAVLLVRSGRHAGAIDLGFDADNLSTITVDLGLHGYEDAARQAFWETATARVRAVPAVASATRASRLPFSLSMNRAGIYVDGHHEPGDKSGFIAETSSVDAEYFSTLGLRIVEGRAFHRGDTEPERAVAIVTQALAERFWPQGAIGQRFQRDGLDGPASEIIGVVADHKVRTIGEIPQPYIYYPISNRSSLSQFAFRSRGDQALARAEVRRALHELDADLAFIEDTDMRGLLSVALFPVRAGAAMLGAFGALAVLLAVIGLYGVVAYSVTQRRREIGVRVAVGAGNLDIVWLVLRQGMRLVGAGAVVGLGAAMLLTGTLSSVLYGVGRIDPIAFLVGGGALCGACVLANLVPAMRAMRLDPVRALRGD